jgi:hypothetical protein
MTDPKIKIATEVPDPPKITEEALRRCAEEGLAFRREMEKRIRKMQTLTPEDWASRCR